MSSGLGLLIGAARALPDRRRAAAKVPDEETSPTPPASAGPQVPAPKLDDWEANKSTIKGLYMDKNLNLKEVVDIMRDAHDLRATARMYKAQFAKWGWSKYNCKRLRRDLSSGRLVEKASGKSCRRTRRRQGQPEDAAGTAAAASHPGGEASVRIKREEGSSSGSLAAAMPFANDACYSIESVLCEIRNHVSSVYTAEPTWRNTRKTGLISAYNYSFYDSFRVAMDNFLLNNHGNGGQVLRKAFVEVEESIGRDYSGVFYFLFIDLPDLLHHYRRHDILTILLDYISQLASVKPKDRIRGTGFAGLQSLVQRNPQCLEQYIKTASRLWTDLLVDLRGPCDRSTLLAKRNYLRHSRSADKAQMAEVVGDYDRLLHEMASDYGPVGHEAQQLEDVILHLQFNFGMFLDDFEARSERLVADVTAKYRYPVPGGDHRLASAVYPLHDWDVLDRTIYSNCHERLVALYQRRGDEPRAAWCRAEAQAGWTDGLSRHIEVEQVLLLRGQLFEAETLRKARLESQYFKLLPGSIELEARRPP